jgi:hypothetical protein
MSKKIPDLVVYSEEKGYYARELTYGSNLGAPAIKTDNISSWKHGNVLNVNEQFSTKYEELKKEFENLIDEYNWNNIIYTKADYNFQPTIGHIYHLYLRKDETLFLSLVDPSSWSQKHIGSFKLNSDNKWVKL